MSDEMKYLPKSLVVGLDNIDSEHEVLFSLFDTLSKAIENNDYLFDLGEIIEELVAYVKFHFKSEEKLMISSGYPNIMQHRKAHKIMTAHVHGYMFRFKSKSESQRNIVVDINDFIKFWFIDHIANDDMNLAKYYNNISDKIS
ncbi:MAG: hemerythrin family protein [Magnetococcales bacterium]|nr:hemerythrin family protein [Magnetococcales bacterium]